MNKIFVVVINWNKRDMTLECLKSLDESIGGKKNIQAVLVDNNSTDKSIATFKRLSYTWLKIIYNSTNDGWTGGHNVGIQYALKNGADTILLLANDAVIEKGSLEKLDTRLHASKKIGIVGPKIYHYDTKPPIIFNAGNFWNKKTYFGIALGNEEEDRGQYDNIKRTDYVAGTAITIKSEVFKKIGLLNDKHFIYYEDNDFCERAARAGFRCEFVQDAIVYHRGAATTVVGSPLHTYYNTRNRLLFIEHFAPQSIRVLEFIRVSKEIVRIVLKNKFKKDKYFLLGVRDYLLRRFGQRKYW